MEYIGEKSNQKAMGRKKYPALSFDCINFVIYHPLFTLQHNIDA